jgi:hypothetical protein
MKRTFQVDENTSVGVHNVSWGQWQISVNGGDVSADTERFGSMSCNLKFEFPDGRSGLDLVRSIAWGARFFVFLAVLQIARAFLSASAAADDSSVADNAFAALCWYGLCALYMWGCAWIARRALVFGAGLTLAFWVSYLIYWNVNAAGPSLVRYAIQVYLLWIAWRVVKKAIDLRADRNNLPTLARVAG